MPDPSPHADPHPERIRPWTLVLGVVLSLGMCAAVPLLSSLTAAAPGKPGPSPFGSYLPMLPLMATLLLAAFRLVRPRENLAITALLLAATGGIGLQNDIARSILNRDALAQDATTRQLAADYPAPISIPPRTGDAEAAIDRAIIGLQRGGNAAADFPAAVVGPPFAWTLLLAALSIMATIALVAFTSRQWTQHERLPHPSLHVHNALAARSILGHRGFQVAAAAVLLYWIYNLLNFWGYHRLPMVPNYIAVEDSHKLLKMDSDQSTRYIIGDFWERLRFRPIAVGIAFFLTLELGFSVWSGFWLGVVLCGWIYAAGIPISFEAEGRMIGCGATFAFAAVILWIGRHHYWTLLRGAFGLGDGRGDRPGVWGCRLLIAGGVALAGLIGWMTDSYAAASLGILLGMAYVIVLARVIAESGLPAFQTAYDLGMVSNHLGLPIIMPFQAIFGLLWFGMVFLYNSQQHISAFAAQGAGVAEQQRLPTGRLLIGVGLIAIAGAAIASGVGLVNAWSGWGLDPVKDVWRTISASAISQRALSDPDGPVAAWQSMFFSSPVLIGAAALFALIAIRRLWPGFAFHPIGLVVATSFPVWAMWFSLFLGWIGKVLVLRYGGPQLYARLKPVAIGLIVGDLLGYFVQYVGIIIHNALGMPTVAWLSPGG